MFKILTYEPFRKLLVEKKKTRGDLVKEKVFSSSTSSKLKKDLPVSLTVIDKICDYFKVQPNQIIDYREE